MALGSQATKSREEDQDLEDPEMALGSQVTKSREEDQDLEDLEMLLLRKRSTVTHGT